MSEPRVLPDRPDLRHLRQEAKRRRKAGEFSSIALAQLAVARDYGFRSWPRLKFHVEAVTGPSGPRAGARELASAGRENLTLITSPATTAKRMLMPSTRLLCCAGSAW